MRPRRENMDSSSPATRHRRARRIVAFVVAALLLAAGASGGELTPRTPLPKTAVKARPAPPGAASLAGSQHRLVVKFRDDVRARAANGRLTSRADAELTGARDVARRFDMSFRPLLKLSEERLARFEKRAAEHSRRAQPDLAGVLVVEMPGAGPKRLEAAGRALQRLEDVEFAYIQTLGQPPPGSLGPTPDFTPLQTYFQPDPGMDVDYAWSLGYQGQGIRLSDCEYAWDLDHEDLIFRVNQDEIQLEENQEINPKIETTYPDYIEHGTAVVGMTSAYENLVVPLGVTGMVPEADVGLYPEWTTEGFRRVDAIMAAIDGSEPGDVVLLEMQDGGAPAEVDHCVWMVTRAGVDAGVVMVAAAGNGTTQGDLDLDGPEFQFYRDYGDSGAIIVGAGTSDVNHDKDMYSSYGSRVNVQGWGENIVSLGYGDLFDAGEHRDYTAIFRGTSGASPFAASAAVILQQAAQNPIAPTDLRDLLIDTGIDQGSGGHIGPFIDLREALDTLLANNPPVAGDDLAATLFETPIDIPFADLLKNDTDPDLNSTWRVCGVGQPDQGTVVWDEDSVTYTPPLGCDIGPFHFTYDVCDNLDGTDTGTVTVNVGGIICPPPSG